MDTQHQKVRSCSRKSVIERVGTPRGSKQICIPMTSDLYKRIWDNAAKVRHLVDSLIKTMPEVFPCGIQDGYQLSGHLPESEKMPGIRLRQLRLRDGNVYTLRPSFVISYMTGTVEDIHRPLLLLTYGVPCWLATRKAFRNLFPTIITVLCFLHGFIKIRNRGRKCRDLHDRVWDVYRAATSAEFQKQMATLRTWCEQASLPKAVMEMAAKLWNRTAEYAVSYKHPGCHRTSNMVDRLLIQTKTSE